MTTLVVVLAAGLALRDVPERFSQAVETDLDLSGEWEGDWRDGMGNITLVRVRGDKLEVRTHRGNWDALPFGVRREGADRVRLTCGRPDFVGLYRQDGGRVEFCFMLECDGFPVSFRVTESQDILTLRRVKPGK